MSSGWEAGSGLGTWAAIPRPQVLFTQELAQHGSQDRLCLICFLVFSFCVGRHLALQSELGLRKHIGCQASNPGWHVQGKSLICCTISLGPCTL